jgi:hypothetical protein
MITLNKKLVLVLCLALLSTQASAQLFGKKEPPKPVTLVPATDRAQAFNELITTGQVLQHVPKIYSGTNKEVAIASLVLEFVTDTAGSSSRGNVMDDRTSTTQMNYKLLGVSPQVMQAIADEFYDHVKQAIMAQGYTVVDQDKLLAIPKFAELVKDTGTVQTGGGLLSKDEFSKATSKGTADLTGVSGGFKKVGLMQSLGLEAPLLLSANIIINFAQFKDIGSSVWTAADQTRSGVQGAVQLAVTKGSGFDFSNAAGSNGFAMVRTTILPSQIAAKVDKVSLSGGQIAAMALSMLTKSSVSNNNYEVTAVDNYKELASADLKMFAEVMAQGLKKQ